MLSEVILENYVLSAVLMGLVLWLWISAASRGKLKLPPGPRGLPLLGYLPFMGRRWHETFRKLAKEYGGVVGMHIGTQYFVILDDFSAVKDAFKKEDFQSRPLNYFQVSPSYKNMIELSGSDWKDHRRFQINTFKSLGLGNKSMEMFITNQIQDTMDALSQEKESNLLSVLDRPLSNVMFFLLYGKAFDAAHPYIRALPDLNRALAMKYQWQEVAACFPFLGTLLPLVHPRYHTVEESVQTMAHIIRNEIQEHTKNLDADEPKDFIDHFLLQMKSKQIENENNFTESSLIGNMLMLLDSGAVTTRLTLSWVLMSLAGHPEEQEKVYQEVLDQVGLERSPEGSDQGLLPYTCATIEESRRLYPMTYFNLFRRCTTDTGKICGYDIPNGAIIVQNQWSLNRNQDYWETPDRFDPTRFLCDGRFRIPEHFIPFSYGKRMCPGSKLASLQLFLFIVCLVRRFRILPPDGGLSMEPHLTFDVLPAKPLLRFQLRN